MEAEIIIKKKLPVETIEKFEDRVVYHTAAATREYVKSRNGFPYLSGKLRSTEIAAPIIGTNKQYALTGGVDYAKYVWNYSNVKWTNKSTMPQWYATAFKDKGAVLITNAVMKSMKEVQ